MSLQIVQIKKRIKVLTARKYRLDHKLDPIYQAKEKIRRKKTYQKYRKKRIEESNHYNKTHRSQVNKASRLRYKKKKDAIRRKQKLSDMWIVFRGKQYDWTRKIVLR